MVVFIEHENETYAGGWMNLWSLLGIGEFKKKGRELVVSALLLAMPI